MCLNTNILGFSPIDLYVGKEIARLFKYQYTWF